MALSANNLQNIVDLPVFEWLRFAPATVTALSALAAPDDYSDSRYIYYLVSTALYRYDTVSDSWMQLSTAPITPVTTVSLKYSNSGGFRARILSGSNNNLLMPTLQNNVLSGSIARIYSGTGNGQIRTVTSVSDPITYDMGVVTATTNAAQLQDTTKKWKINQWIGYQVSLIFGTGVTQRRKVLYNSDQILFFSDPAYQQIEPWNNVMFSSVTPYSAPVSTAGSQTIYKIEAGTVSVNSDWDIAPDSSSRIVLETGGIWALSAAAATPFYTLQYYDIAADMWIPKTACGGLLVGALNTDFALEKITDGNGVYITGSIITASNNRVISCSAEPSNSLDRWVNYELRITSGSGMGQRRRILANTTSSFEVNRAWDVTPTSTSVYSVYDDRRNAYIAGNGSSSMFLYQLEADLTTQGYFHDYGLARSMSVAMNGYEGIAVTSGSRNTGSVTAINVAPTAKGTNYVIGDVLTISTGGSGGKVYVEAISVGGLVESMSLYAAGSGYTTGTGKSTTGGTGTGCTVEITTTGSTGRIITAITHSFKSNDLISFTGATENAWNTSSYILAVDSLSSFDIPLTATASAVASASQSTTTLTDSTATWDVNEHVGKLVQISTFGTASTSQFRRITANSSTTLTLQSAITTAANGLSRFAITDPDALGRDEAWQTVGKTNAGYATTGSTTTLTDSTKNWIPNQWASNKFRIITGTGRFNEITITSNTTNTLTYSTQTFTPDTTTKYIIMDSFGLATAGSTTTLTDSTKNWVVNQWAGKRVRLTSGTGIGYEYAITSNTATILTFGTGTSPSTDTTYTILAIPPRSTGINMFHAWGKSNNRGRYIYMPRGGATNQWDIYDITKNTFMYGCFTSPMFETLTTGTMYAYDGADRIYFTKDATGRIYVLDLNTNLVQNAGQIPYGMSTALIGNRMEIVNTSDGLQYLYILRHSSTEFWRQLIYY